MYKDMEARKEYARKWRQRARAENVDGVFGVYKLTDAEKICLGLKKPAPLRGTIHIVIPEHYGSSAAMWTSRFVTEAQLPGFLKQYPDLQIIDRAALAKYQPEEDQEPEEEEEEEIIIDDEPEDGFDDSEERWEMYR